MIRIIRAVLVKTPDAPADQFPILLDIVPASGSLEMKKSNDEQGYSTSWKLSFRVRTLWPAEKKVLKHGCVCIVKLDGPGPMADIKLGTEQLPVFFTVEDNLGTITLSASWKSC